MKVVVSGSAGHLGRVLMPLLHEDERITELIGLDQCTDPRAAYQQIQANLLDVDADALFQGCDSFVHMAFVLMGGGLGQQRHDRDAIRQVNVAGSQRLFDAAIRQGVKRIVFISSCAVYGAWPDNPEHMDETQPMRPNPGFAYAEDKTAVEHYLEQLAQKHTDRVILRLRPHVILGTHAHPLLRYLLKQPFYPRLTDPQPLTQCVWETDVAQAIQRSLTYPHSGVFNLAATPAMSFRQMQQRKRRWSIPLPAHWSRPLHALAWRLTPLAGEPGWVDGMQHSLAVNSERATKRLGWTPEYSVQDCIDRV